MTLKLKAQILCGDEIAMGPGKADLLGAIDREGSITKAAKAMGMSYRRAWLLVDVMNRCWVAPLVETAAGGSRGGGAHLTDTGREVLVAYQRLDRSITSAALESEEALVRLARPEPLPTGR